MMFLSDHRDLRHSPDVATEACVERHGLQRPLLGRAGPDSTDHGDRGMTDRCLAVRGATLPNVRSLLLVPVAVIGVLTMHGLADAGTPYLHAEVERSMSSHHSVPAPEHTNSHLAAMSICGYALLIAAHQLRRGPARCRAPQDLPSQWTGRITAEPEPPVPRPVV